jgi:hypothetical protein
MKSRLALFASISFSVLVFAACGSDDDSGGKSGTGGKGGNTSGGGSGGKGGSASGGGGTSGGSGGTTAGGGSAGSSAGGSGGGSGCSAITTFDDGKTPKQILHVSPSGNDANDGAEATPKKTIEAAAKLATPGTEVRVHAGTYAGDTYLADLAGSATDPIWIGGAPGEAKPLIQGGGEALHFTKIRYLVIHDLEINGATGNGINTDDGGAYADAEAARYVVFRNLSIHDIGTGGNEDCLKLSGLNDYWVLDSDFARCGGAGSGSGIDHVGCHHGLIAHSTFTDMSGNAVQAKGGSLDIEVRACLMKNAGERAVNMGGSTGLEFFRPPLSTSAPNYEAKDIRVVANVIVGGVAALGFVGCVDCLAANNTIVDPTNWIFRILQETTTGSGYTFLEAANGRFMNNLVYFSRAELSTTVNVGAGTNAASFQFANNLWYAHDNPGQSQPTDLPATETAGVVGQDPMLTDAAAGNYHIGATSPAAGSGTALSEVAADYDAKCYAAPPSIGAFEKP